jgi:HSP20 family protein
MKGEIMSQLTQQLKNGAEHAFESLSEGWRDLRARAGEALTRFRLPVPSRSDARSADEDPGEPLPSLQRWGFMAADVFEDDRRVVVRLEAPGMHKDDFAIELEGATLTIRGEKRIDREQKKGGWHLRQCAYGTFRRSIALPVEVQPDKCSAHYRDGVLRIELAKAEGARSSRIAVTVH